MSIPATQSRWGRLPDAIAHSKLGRGSLYELAAKHQGLFKKRGAATIVDLEFLDRILAELPAAEIGVEKLTELPAAEIGVEK